MSKSIKIAALLSVGDYSVAVADLPSAVQHTLMQRTFSHIINNEAAAVRTRLAGERNAEGEAKYNDAELAATIHDWRIAKIEAMLDGQFSLRVVGPRMTGDEKILREFARDSIVNALTKAKKPMPKASETDAWNTAVDAFLANPKTRAMADAELARRKSATAPAVELPDDIFAKVG